MGHYDKEYEADEQKEEEEIRDNYESKIRLSLYDMTTPQLKILSEIVDNISSIQDMVNLINSLRK